MMGTAVSTINIQSCGLPLFVAVNQHEELVRILFIYSLVDISEYKLAFDMRSFLQIANNLLFTANLKLAVGALIGLLFGVTVSFWTKKVVRDNHNLIQLILGGLLILYSLFKLFGSFGSQFSALVSFILTVKVMGFAKFRFDGGCG